MCPRLRFRKTFRRLTSNSKGFSSIVGAIFAVLLMISLISTVFVWSLSQNTLYNNTVRETNLLDLDRSNERIATNITCYGDGLGAPGTVLVNGWLENDGPLSVQLVTLWVVDATNKEYTHIPVNIVLTPGNNITLSQSVPLPNSEGDSIGAWFISARGNTISEKSFSINYYNEGTEIPPYSYTTGGIGSLAFDFDTLVYFTVTGNTFNPPNGYPAYSVPALNNLALGFNLTNYNVNHYNITLDGGVVTQGSLKFPGPTIIWSYFPSSPGQTLGPRWSLVSNQSNTFSTTYEPITLEYGKPKFLLFAYQWGAFDKIPMVGAINLVFYGKFTTMNNGIFDIVGSYGQNAPFVTIYFTLPP